MTFLSIVKMYVHDSENSGQIISTISVKSRTSAIDHSWNDKIYDGENTLKWGTTEPGYTSEG